MSSQTTTRTLPRRAAAPASRIRAALSAFSSRAHATGDADAQAHGWSVAVVPGRLGLGGRAYRDHRFDDLSGR